MTLPTSKENHHLEQLKHTEQNIRILMVMNYPVIALAVADILEDPIHAIHYQLLWYTGICGLSLLHFVHTKS